MHMCVWCAHMHTGMCACVNMLVWSYVHAYVCVSIYLHVYAYMHVRIYVFVCRRAKLAPVQGRMQAAYMYEVGCHSGVSVSHASHGRGDNEGCSVSGQPLPSHFGPIVDVTWKCLRKVPGS